MLKTKNQKRIEEVENVACHLFANNGYHSTSMRTIARELNMNQATLYHYFSSKEDLLFKLMDDAIENSTNTLKRICAADILWEDKLKAVLNSYTRYFAGYKEGEILLLNEMNSLSEPKREILIKKQRHFVELFKTILNDASADHKLEQIHTTVAIFAFFGMVHYTVKWYNKDGEVNLEELAAMFSKNPGPEGQALGCP
ncbi:MAG: TetR/AcrR family transcriptional regulator [Chlorobiales bacterium]|nr:TetR/AcrR family transcriptional regulator [Chlorobiales bacterium]